jgi:hypothetical protein
LAQFGTTLLSVASGQVGRRRVVRPASVVDYIVFVALVFFVTVVSQKLKSALIRISRPFRIEFGCSHGPFGVKLLL